MCVIAGYIGNKLAAPILLKMLRREEGLAGGYYSGIATIDNGELHFEKVVGDAATLETETAVAQLRGNIGIAHSRTPSGGGREWSHPFVDTANRLAYIANGSVGQFDNLPQLAALSQELMEAGHRFGSVQSEAVGNYPTLKNGLSVHFSDTFCQAIAAAYAQLPPQPHRLLHAASRTYQSTPNEIVGLCLHADHPDEIVAVRHNKPLEIGRDADGAWYLATTTLAFPEGVTWQMRMPPNAGAVFHRAGWMHIEPFTETTIPVGPFPSPNAILDCMMPLLCGSEPPRIHELCEAVKKLWPGSTLDEKEIAVFETLAALHAENRIRFENRQVPGMFDKGTVPQTRIRWNTTAK